MSQILNGSVLANAQIGFKTIYAKAFEAASVFDGVPASFTMEKLANVVPSNTSKEQYKWFGSLPLMQKWTDEATFEKLDAYSWEIVNDTWDAGIEVAREDIEDDTLALVVPSIQTLGTEARQHPGRLLMDLLTNGFTTKGYDNQYFFDTDHKDGGGPSQSNVDTHVLSAANYHTARAAMRRVTDNRGRALGILPTHLIVPPELENTGKSILTVERLASGATNPDFGTAELVVSPYLSDDDGWFLLDMNKAFKPLIFQTRRAPEFVAQDRPTDEVAMTQRRFRYQVNARYAAGYGLWQFAYGSTGEDA